MKVQCLYTEYYLYQMHLFLYKNKLTGMEDASGKLWTINELSDILINKYGYKKTGES